MAAIGAVVAVEVLSGGADEGREAPALPKTALLGPKVDLADLRGHPAAINFFASWCGPCRKEAPDLKAVSKSLPDGAALVGVAWNDGFSAARDFARGAGWTYPTLFDANGTVGDRYGIQGMPTTFILNSDGRIDAALRGPQDAATLRRALSEAG